MPQTLKSPSKQKSVKLLVDCLFTIVGSGKPFPPNKHEQFTLIEREPSLAYPRRKFTRLHNSENKS
jgi:hypothetical protein